MKSLVTALVLGTILGTASLGSPAAFAADPAQPPNAAVQASQPRAAVKANAAPTLPDRPDAFETAGALAGGLLVIGLAAFGLTITFRSLRQEIKGRRNRYRRRVRRETGSAGA
jgi:hypothetical protein